MRPIPLVCILQPRELAEPIAAIKRELIHVDKLWIKYHENVTAYSIMESTFLRHTEYSHLVILPDDLVVTREAYDYLYEDIYKHGSEYSVISGYCNLENTSLRSHLSNICIEKLPPNPPHLGTLEDYDFATLDQLTRLRNHGFHILKVAFAGFPLTFISRRILERGITFRDDKGCCEDSLFAWDLWGIGEPQYVDLRSGMRHLKIDDGHYENMQVGKKEPRLIWEFREK